MQRQTSTSKNLEKAERYNGFWPLLLIACSLMLIFSWEIRVGIYTRRSATQLREQQLRVVEQANRVQGELEKLVRGLLELSKTDPAAKEIVTKYGIKVGNSPSPAPSL